MSRCRAFLLFAVMISSVYAYGQSVTADFDKKVIYVDSLNLPENTTALRLIFILPELIQRPGDFIVVNYDIQVEGMSVGIAADDILGYLHIMDIEKIEVSESPVSSYQKNGQGGSINFLLRSKGKNRQDLWGSAGVGAGSPLDVSPYFNIGYKKDKFMVRGFLLGELYNSTNDVQTIKYSNGDFLSQSYTGNVNRFRTEMARAYLQYNITPKDELKLNLSETYTYGRTATSVDFDRSSATTRHQESTVLHTYLHYKHTASSYSFTAQAEYVHSPIDKDYDVEDLYDYDSNVKSNNLSGKLELKARLFDNVSPKGRKNTASLTFGSNFNASFGDQSIAINDHSALEFHKQIIPQNDTYYIMPYLNFEGVFGKMRLKVVGEYQHFEYKVKRLDKPFSSTSNDITGTFITEYNVKPGNTLRLMFERKLKRPGSEQLFPYRLFDADLMEYVKGNPDLTPIKMHQVTLDYIGLNRWESYHTLTYNVGVSYNNINDIVVPLKVNQGTAGAGGIDPSGEYTSYINDAKEKVVSANLMGIYTYKSFTLSVAGNIYHKDRDDIMGGDHCNYYNLSIHPHFKLKQGWDGGAGLLYFSKLNSKNGYVGDCAMAEITVGRAIGNFYIYLAETVSMMDHNTDQNISGVTRTEVRYHLSPNIVSLGLKYAF